MNYSKLNDTDFESAVTAVWHVGMHMKSAQCWLYQKNKLEGLILLYATGEVVEDLALLVKIVEYTILQLKCDDDESFQDLYINQIMETDIYHSLDMISRQARLAAKEGSSESKVLREKLDNDFKMMEDKLSMYSIGDGHLYTDETIEGKTQRVYDRLNRVRLIAEGG